MLKRVGYVDADLIENHGNNPADYINDFIPSARIIPKELVLLWEADMLIDSKVCPGQEITFEQRLESVAKKCGKDSIQYKNKKAKMDRLIKYKEKFKVQKTEVTNTDDSEERYGT